MKHLRFHFDVISPYACLAFERLPQALEGLSVEVSYEPLLFAGLLQHWGNKGPAEIEPKRAWTFRQVAWLAHQHGVRLDTPAQHPFNPLALLRLALACGDGQGRANRYVCETILRHVWRGGVDAADPARLGVLTALLQPAQDPQGDAVKALLKANTDDAIARGLFGVPAFTVDDKLFWGFDALPMLRAYLSGDGWFADNWQAAAERPAAVGRVNKG